MLLKTFWRENKEEHFVQSFQFARPLPSGHTEIIYSGGGTVHGENSVHYEILFVDFVREWNRMH